MAVTFLNTGEPLPRLSLSLSLIPGLSLSLSLISLSLSLTDSLSPSLSPTLPQSSEVLAAHSEISMSSATH